MAAPARAHEGPPYPVLMDRLVGPYVLSVWADPDVGIGTFYAAIEGPEGQPREPRLQIEVWPSTRRLEPITYPTERQRSGIYWVEVPFDREELWTVRFRLSRSGEPRDIAYVDIDVSVTPPGYGAWDVPLYLAPFLLVGALWMRAAVRSRSHANPATARVQPDGAASD